MGSGTVQGMTGDGCAAIGEMCVDILFSVGLGARTSRSAMLAIFLA
jgi:hypothetical protein